MNKILMVIAPKDFRDEEYFVPKSVFEKAGYTVVTASTVSGTVDGSHGGSTTSDILLTDVDAKDYVSVVFVGGKGSYALDDNTDAHSIALDFHSQNKYVNAICHAPIIVAKTGLLSGLSATVFDGDYQQLIELGAKYINNDVVKDSQFITANGPAAADPFANLILENIIGQQDQLS